MNKQELYSAYAGKFDRVQPVADWQKINTLVGVTRYNVQTYKEGIGFNTYTIYVTDDGGTNEKAVVGGTDPLVEVPAQFDFNGAVTTMLNGLVTAGTIKGYIQSVAGFNFSEYFIYRVVSNVLTKESYLVWKNTDNSIGYQKIG